MLKVSFKSICKKQSNPEIPTGKGLKNANQEKRLEGKQPKPENLLLKKFNLVKITLEKTYPR